MEIKELRKHHIAAMRLAEYVNTISKKVRKCPLCVEDRELLDTLVLAVMTSTQQVADFRNHLRHSERGVIAAVKGVATRTRNRKTKAAAAVAANGGR